MSSATVERHAAEPLRSSMCDILRNQRFLYVSLAYHQVCAVSASRISMEILAVLAQHLITGGIIEKPEIPERKEEVCGIILSFFIFLQLGIANLQVF